MTPTVLLALIERMSPQELINNLGALQRRGAFDNPDLKAPDRAKLEEAKTAARVSAFKAEEAVQGRRPVRRRPARSWSRWPTRRSRPGAGSRGRRPC